MTASVIVSRVTADSIDETQARAMLTGRDGALVVFIGAVRDQNQGFAITGLEYEAYGAMAEQQMDSIAREAKTRWELTGIAMIHRVGKLEIGETSVLVAASAPHRREAFAGCQFCIDTLKDAVPIWKKEFRSSGESEWLSS